MEKAERDLIMRQQIVLPQTPRERRELAALDEDLKAISLTGTPSALRLRNFRSSAEAYLASSGGPLPYMLRLREIERQTAAQEAKLHEAWRALADESSRRSSLSSRTLASIAGRVAVRRGQRPDRAPQPLVPRRVEAGDGPEDGRLRQGERPGLPPASSSTRVGCSSASRPRSTLLSPPDGSPVRTGRMEP